MKLAPPKPKTLELQKLQEENVRTAEIIERYARMRDDLERQMRGLQRQMVTNLERQFILIDLNKKLHDE